MLTNICMRMLQVGKLLMELGVGLLMMIACRHGYYPTSTDSFESANAL